MSKVQENGTTGALTVQIPKAIAIAKGIKKGSDVKFLLNEKGELLLDVKK